MNKMHNVLDERIKEIVKAYSENGLKKTAQIFGFKEDSVRRYLDEAERRGMGVETTSKVLRDIAENYTQDELKAIAKGGRILPGVEKVPIISFEGKHIRIGAITDTHIGHLEFSKDRLMQALEQFKKEKVDFITHSGDVTEGMSHRAGHIYELSHLGYDKQKNYAVDLFGQWTDTPIYAIDGNHDRWFIKSNGAYIVKDIAKELDNFHFIGHDEGDISLKGKANLKLWHGEDGNSYALSYRLQKILESLSGGQKPNVMFCGHTHKYVKVFERNVHAISVGCMEGQTKWMRGKRIAAHVSFCIFDIWVNDKGVCKLTEILYPFYA